MVRVGQVGLPARLPDLPTCPFRPQLVFSQCSISCHNDLGTALASLGEIDQAIEQFKLAVSLEPTFDEARNNLASALHLRRRSASRPIVGIINN